MLIEDHGEAPVPPSCRDGDVVRFPFATRRRWAEAELGHELHRNRRLRIGIFEVVDQLRQILDGVDVVVRRRRNQPDAGVE